MGKGESDEMSNLCASILLHFNCMSCGHCCWYPPPLIYSRVPLQIAYKSVSPSPPTNNTHTPATSVFFVCPKRKYVCFFFFSFLFLFFSFLGFAFAFFFWSVTQLILHATFVATLVAFSMLLPPLPPPFFRFLLLPCPANSTTE